jgi:hypothetical protein
MYFLDTLCDPMTSMAISTTSSLAESSPYPALLAKYLQVLVDIVVPPEREGVLNLMSARQVCPRGGSIREAPTQPLQIYFFRYSSHGEPGACFHQICAKRLCYDWMNVEHSKSICRRTFGTAFTNYLLLNQS